jgi:hypothetical protein
MLRVSKKIEQPQLVTYLYKVASLWCIWVKRPRVNNYSKDGTGEFVLGGNSPGTCCERENVPNECHFLCGSGSAGFFVKWKCRAKYYATIKTCEVNNAIGKNFSAWQWHVLKGRRILMYRSQRFWGQTPHLLKSEACVRQFVVRQDLIACFLYNNFAVVF